MTAPHKNNTIQAGNVTGMAERCTILMRSVAAHPRVQLGHFPTPLEPMDRLSEALGGPRIWVKRDDCTGLASGGNKTRKLEFLIADALEKNADTIITQGATQSNHVRQTAAAAARFGLNCRVLLEDRTGFADSDYTENGNVVLDRFLGAKIEVVPGGTNMNAAMAALAEKVEAESGKPYIIPGGGSNAIGALGYVNCAREMFEQAANAGFSIDTILHATGSSGTQAGLVAGLAALETDTPLLGIGVRAPQEKQEDMVYQLARKTMDHLGMGHTIRREAVQADCRFIGDGYGLPTPGMWNALKMLAELEGLLFDPVYSGKGLDGLITLVREGAFSGMDNIVFIHTGGSAGLFGYLAHMDGIFKPTT